MKLVRASAVVLVLLQASLLARQTSINVTPLPRDGRVFVTFKMTNAFGDETRSAVHSGLSITFVYDVELRRSAALWVDRTIASATVTASVRYDNLTGRYHLTRSTDGRIDRAEVVEREAQAREWLTEFDRLPLFSSGSLEPNVDYYVRVRAHTTPRNASFVWPWQGSDVSGLAKFTFLR
jgi:hypothetical protein